MPTFFGIDACALGFDYGKGLPVSSEQHVVGIADLGLIGHPVYFDFDAGFGRLYIAFGVKNFPSGLA